MLAPAAAAGQGRGGGGQIGIWRSERGWVILKCNMTMSSKAEFGAHQTQFIYIIQAFLLRLRSPLRHDETLFAQNELTIALRFCTLVQVTILS